MAIYKKWYFWLIMVIVLFAIIALSVLGWYVNIVNTAISLDEGVKSQWAQVESQYQRRADLIPNLVSTVKGYASHEKETFQATTEARSKASSIQITPEALRSPELMKKFAEVQGSLGSALSRLMAVREAYPDLKANQNFLALQSQLEGTENRISVERKRYNDIVKQFNTYIKSIPQRFILAGQYEDYQPFTAITENAEQAPAVDF